MNSFKVAKKSKYESLFSQYSSIFELFQRSTSWHSGPKLKSVWVALFASTRTTSSSLIPLFLLHRSLCCSSNTTISLNRGPAVQRMCKTKTLFADLQAMWMEGGGWWWLVGAAILFWNQFGGSHSAPLQPSCPSTAAQ